MNYQQTLDYLYTQLPMFTRIGAAALKNDLNNTIALCNHLGNPQNRFASVHIAGTNGKGSTAHILSSVLQSAGYKTGLYTSPHLKDFRERIRINGQFISQEFVVEFVSRNQSFFKQIEPSFFEMTVGLCFDYLAKQKVDIAIIETGLGGRLDSTNIINPILSVITNIGWDHMDLLGDTLPKIASEKAGIIKKNTPVVIGETHIDTAPVFLQKAAQENAPIFFADQKFSITNFNNNTAPATCNVWQDDRLEYPNLQFDLTGIYQQKNFCTALTAIQKLQQMGYAITKEHIYKGFAQVTTNTGLLGRWQKLSDSPLTFADTGHNFSGIEEVLKQIALLQFNHLHIVWGMVKDKDVSKILTLLPTNATYYFCNAQLPRALPADEMREKAAVFGLKGRAYTTVKEALQEAMQVASANDLVFVGGSTFVVAEVV